MKEKLTISILKPNMIVRGPILPEPVQVIVTIPMGDSIKLIGKGLRTGQVHEPILSPEQLATLEATPEVEPFDGDAGRFRLGVEAMRLGLAYEYDPFFTLSIAHVDPLPHQLEAVYDYFLKLPRIRFLLADDPGAGKTIMAGLLIKELKIRGLIQRTLIVTPANLSFQWQREMKDKFREDFEVIRSDVLRANYGSNPWQEKNQVITSVSWVSRIEDAKESLLRSHWDLIIVDEAHKMSEFTPCRFDTINKTVRALAVVHTELVLIHPFRDGNGRVARILATLMALQAELPPLDFGSLKGYRRKAYYVAIRAGLNREYKPMEDVFSGVIRKTLRRRRI